MAKSIVASMASTASAAPVAVLSDYYYYSLKDEGSKKCYKQKIALFQWPMCFQSEPKSSFSRFQVCTT